MDANPFDQFDAEAAAPPQTQAATQAAPPAPAQPSTYPFDQFDQPQHPVAGPTGNFFTDWARRLGTDAINAAAGVAALPRAAAEGIDWLGNKVGANIGADKALASIPNPANSDYPLFPDFQTAKEAMFSGPGLSTGGTEYKAATLPGRLTDAAITGAFGGIANPASIPATAGGAATSEMARELFPNHPFWASLLGFIPGAWTAQRLAQAPSQVAGAVAGNAKNATYQAYERLGIPTELTGDVTGNPSMQFLQTFAGKMPGAEDAIGEARNRAVSGWNAALETAASKLGTASTAQEAGESLQYAANKWLSNFKADTANKWSTFRLLVPKNTPVPVTNFQSTLNDVLQDFGGADALAKVLQPKLASDLQGALGQDLKGGNTLPWQTIQSVRSRLGEMLEGAQPVEGMSLSNVRRLYGALSQDMQAGATSAGPAASRAFNIANAATAAGHDLLDNYINPILKANNPEEATRYALAQAKQGGTKLSAITFNLPSASGDLAAYTMRNAAGAESPSAFASFMAGSGAKRPALSPEAQQALFPTPEAQQAVQDLTRAGQAMRATERAANTSNTAVHETRGPIGRAIVGREMADIGGDLAGTPGRVAGFMGGAFAPEIFGRTAKVFALNPMLARLYATQPLVQFTAPGMLQRAPTLTLPQSVFGVPATSANYPTQ